MIPGRWWVPQVVLKDDPLGRFGFTGPTARHDHCSGEELGTQQGPTLWGKAPRPERRQLWRAVCVLRHFAGRSTARAGDRQRLTLDFKLSVEPLHAGACLVDLAWVAPVPAVSN